MPFYPFTRTIRRPIESFNGQAVVIGCGETCHSHLHDNQTIFYSIDLCNETAAFNSDIRGKLPDNFNNRFELTLLECLDVDAYNELPECMAINCQGNKGFDNIWSITAENGFILIVGSARSTEFRQCLYSRHLHYIELNDDGSTLLIPKNQTWSLTQLKEKLHVLAPELQTCINKAAINVDRLPIPMVNWEFCSPQKSELINELGRDKQFVRTRNINAGKQASMISAENKNRQLLDIITQFVDAYTKNAHPNTHDSLQNYLREATQLLNKLTHAEVPSPCSNRMLIDLASHIFQHRHWLVRGIIDALLCATIVVPLGSLFFNYNPLLFSSAKTRREKALEVALNQTVITVMG